MKYYTDKVLATEVKSLKLGIVSAGEKKSFEFYVVNDTKAYMRDIVFKVAHSEVEVLNAPESLDPGESGRLVLEWFPSVTVEEGLEAQVLVSGRRLYGKL